MDIFADWEQSGAGIFPTFLQNEWETKELQIEFPKHMIAVYPAVWWLYVASAG